MPYGISLSIITAKTPFLSSLLIFLHHKSVNGASCTKTNISAYRDCLADIPAELTDMPAGLTDISIEVMWFSVTGFLVTECFQGRP